jgi:predicted nuclease of predicted toxin-antitoxin system
MIFFLDENFPKAAYKYLVDHAHQVIDVRGTENEGSSDKSLFEMALKHRAIFLTTDKDFYHTIPQLYPKHYGVVVILLRKPNREGIMARLIWFLENFKEETISGNVFLIKDHTYIVFPGSDDL